MALSDKIRNVRNYGTSYGDWSKKILQKVLLVYVNTVLFLTSMMKILGNIQIQLRPQKQINSNEYLG